MRRWTKPPRAAFLLSPALGTSVLPTTGATFDMAPVARATEALALDNGCAGAVAVADAAGVPTAGLVVESGIADGVVLESFGDAGAGAGAMTGAMTGARGVDGFAELKDEIAGKALPARATRRSICG